MAAAITAAASYTTTRDTTAGRMQELQASGLRPAEIAAELNMNRASVYRVLKEVGLAPAREPVGGRMCP